MDIYNLSASSSLTEVKKSQLQPKSIPLGKNAYNAFCATQTKKLTVMYPFLAPQQIRNKVIKLWADKTKSIAPCKLKSQKSKPPRISRTSNKVLKSKSNTKQRNSKTFLVVDELDSKILNKKQPLKDIMNNENFKPRNLLNSTRTYSKLYLGVSVSPIKNIFQKNVNTPKLQYNYIHSTPKAGVPLRKEMKLQSDLENISSISEILTASTLELDAKDLHESQNSKSSHVIIKKNLNQSQNQNSNLDSNDGNMKGGTENVKVMQSDAAYIYKNQKETSLQRPYHLRTKQQVNYADKTSSDSSSPPCSTVKTFQPLKKVTKAPLKKVFCSHTQTAQKFSGITRSKKCEKENVSRIPITKKCSTKKDQDKRFFYKTYVTSEKSAEKLMASDNKESQLFLQTASENKCLKEDILSDLDSSFSSVTEIPCKYNLRV